MTHTPPPITIAAFYKFRAIADPTGFRDQVVTRIGEASIHGIFLVATEGINATISGNESELRELLAWLETEVGKFDVKFSSNPEHPFRKLRVRVRPSIIPFGDATCDPESNTGVHVEPEDWNELISRPGITLIDTRNKYEIRAGSFEGAADPRLGTFADFPEYADTALPANKASPIAMFCTGGIRCEKASAYLRERGFENVYQLSGGILRYLEAMPKSESLWRGECFVFDERITVDHDLKPGTFAMCPACGSPLSRTDVQKPDYVAGKACTFCREKKSDDTKKQSLSI